MMLWRLDRLCVLERSGYAYDAFRYVVIKRPAKIQSAQNCKLQVLLDSSCKVLAGLLRKICISFSCGGYQQLQN